MLPDAIATRPVRRLISADHHSGPRAGTSYAVADGPVETILRDPARPGFTSTRIWVTDAAPTNTHRQDVLERIPDALEPPRGGSVFRLYTIPPDAGWIASITAEKVATYFNAAGSPHASRYSASAPHPYMQQTRTLDLCVVLEGSITLVLDKEQVELAAGDTIVQRGTSHAWSNRSDQPCVVAVSSHDAADERVRH